MNRVIAHCVKLASTAGVPLPPERRSSTPRQANAQRATDADARCRTWVLAHAGQALSMWQVEKESGCHFRVARRVLLAMAATGEVTPILATGSNRIRFEVRGE